MILFSVIIPVRNRPEQLRRCLAGIRAGIFPPDRYEILVVDNGSTDATPAVAAEFAGVGLLSEPVPNRCRARNHGAEAARAPWLVFIDSDCVPDPGWLLALSQAAQALEIPLSPDAPAPPEKVAVLAGQIRAAAPHSSVEAFIARRRWIDQEKFLTPGRRFSPPFAATANLAVRREVYQSLGGLDPALAVAGEDADFCWRAARAGWALSYVPEAAVTHCHRSTLTGLWRQSYHYGIGQVDLFAKWREPWGVRAWVEPRHYSWALKGLFKFPLRLAIGRTPLTRLEPFYDFLANTAMAAGRLRAGYAHRLPVL